MFISVGVQFESLKGLVMALAYCWGLVLAIYLMGHGLVAIPRSLFRNARVSGRLRRIQAAAPKVFEKMEDAINKLEDLEAQVAELNQRKTGSAKIFGDWIEELAEAASIPESRPRTLHRRLSEPDVSVPNVITEGYLADLTRKLNRARHNRIRYTDEWDRLLQSAAATQNIIDSASSKSLEIGKSSPQASFLERFTIFTPYTRYLYYAHVVPYCRVFFGAFFTLASICIIWSELVKVAFPFLSVIGLTVVHHPSSDRGQIGFPGQVIASMWICYMCAAALISLTEVKVWRGRALVRRNTAYESAFWYAMQVAKLTVPLSYNFMTFIPDVYKLTTFYTFFGQSIVLTPLGKWFDYLFPIFVLVPVSMTLFNLYGKVKRLFGFGVIDDDDCENVAGYGTGGWREGRDLIERELEGGSSFGGLRHESNRPPRTRPTYPATPSERNVAPPSRVAPRSSTAATVPTAAEDESFLEAFGHRLRNTLDTMPAPKWMQGGLKKPKWMTTSTDDDAADARGSGGDGITRLFGGRGDNGHVRL